MADGNPFAVPPTNLTGDVNDLLTNYRRAQALQKQQALETARKQALSGLMQGGDPTDAVRKLMGIGDVEGASLLAKAVKNMQPATAKPMTEYQQWQKTHDQATEERARATAYLSSIPESRRDFLISNPGQADPQYKWAMGVLTGNAGGGGDTGMPPPTPQPGMQPMNQETLQAEPSGQPQPPVQPAGPTTRGLSYEDWNAIRTGKKLHPEDAQKRANLIILNLENTKNAAQRLIDHPGLEAAVGGAGTMFGPGRTAQPGEGFWDRATTLWPGVGNMLSSTGEHGKIVPSGILGGTDVANAQAAINSLRDDISLAVIANLKETGGKAGSTGLGRVMQVEYAGWQNALGSLDPNQKPEQFRQNLQRVIDYVTESEKNILGALRDDYGGATPPGVSNVPKSQAPPPTTLIPGTQTISTPPPGAQPTDNTPDRKYITKNNPNGNPPTAKNKEALKAMRNDPMARQIFDEQFGRGRANEILSGG